MKLRSGLSVKWCALLLGAVLGVNFARETLAQEPVILSVTPANGAMNVPVDTSIVFIFSDPMDTLQTGATFIDMGTFQVVPTTASWNGSWTMLTCTPDAPLPAGAQILWSVDGLSLFDEPLGGVTMGGFDTAGGLSNTNEVTLFSVGKLHGYQQLNAGAPALNPETGYWFSAMTSLRSNETATAVTLTKPGGGTPLNLTQVPFNNWTFFLNEPSYTNLSNFEAAYPSGNYSFSVVGSPNQAMTVNLSPSMQQPNAPQVTNYAGAQAIDPAQAFRLGWNPFTGGTASDYIEVSIGGVFSTPDAGAPNALRGTNTSVVIPAGTLEAGVTYETTIYFYRWTYDASNATHHKAAYRCTYTDLQLATVGAAGPVLTNCAIVGGVFQFEVEAPVGETVFVESASQPGGPWSPLVMTTSPGRFLVTDSQPANQGAKFFRAWMQK